MDFKAKLLKTTYSYDSFVNWKKVETNAEKHAAELGLLNPLTQVPNREERKRLLEELFSSRPEVITVIPILLAVRDQAIDVVEMTEHIEYKNFRFGSPESQFNRTGSGFL
jgi:type II restriction enzyme